MSSTLCFFFTLDDSLLDYTKDIFLSGGCCSLAALKFGPIVQDGHRSVVHNFFSF